MGLFSREINSFGTNPAYDAAWSEATAQGWPTRQLDGAHFHMCVEPRVVAESLLEVVDALHSASTLAGENPESSGR